MNENKALDVLNSEIKEEEVTKYKVYNAPKITNLGAMQKITLDSSQIGFDDSGAVGSYKAV